VTPRDDYMLAHSVTFERRGIGKPISTSTFESIEKQVKTGIRVMNGAELVVRGRMNKEEKMETVLSKS